MPEILAITRLQLNEHAALANFSFVNTVLATRTLGAIVAGPPRLTETRQLRARTLNLFAYIVREGLVCALSLAGAVIWAVDNAAVFSSEAWVAPARPIDTFPVAATLVGALLVSTVDTGMVIVTQTSGRFGVTESVPTAVVRALMLGAVGCKEVGVALAFSSCEVARAVSTAVLRTQGLFAQLATESSSAEASQVGAEATSIAIVLTHRLRAIVTSEIRDTLALASNTLAIARALIGADLDRTICSSPAAITFTCAIVAVAIAEAVVQTDTGRAVHAGPPVIAFAQPSGLVALSVVHAVIEARFSATIITLPAVGTHTCSSLAVAYSISRTVFGTLK